MPSYIYAVKMHESCPGLFPMLTHVEVDPAQSLDYVVRQILVLPCECCHIPHYGSCPVHVNRPKLFISSSLTTIIAVCNERDIIILYCHLVMP